MNTVTVTPVSKWKAIRHALALGVTALGAFAAWVQQAQPQLLEWFPHVAWLPKAITAVGLAWYFVEHLLLVGNTTEVGAA